MSDPNALAIVGMAGRFPGADDVDELWRNLCAGVESIRRLDPDELDALGVPDELRDHRDFVPAAAVLSGPEYFDAEFFQIHPRDAARTDPQHRVFLECAWHALEDAGYDPAAAPGPVGVYAGATLNSYLVFNLAPTETATASAFESLQVGSLNAGEFLTSRVAYKLGLTGPAQTVLTACSTSLVAVHQAAQALLLGECDTALAGGVSVQVHHRGGYVFRPDTPFSADGRCRAFDVDAAGTVFGSGCGVVVLRRLADAIAAADRIRAVLLGSAVNNDGDRKAGFTAPSVGGQAQVIAQALANASVRADTVGYVEAHGTGTVLGDPIEVRALTRAYRAHTDRRTYCAIGSVKGNVGHLDAAAGAVGLIKTVLAVEHGQIPPTLHFTAPNPELDLPASPFFVNADLRDWTAPAGHPRRAAVSSFGVGGTNAHAILQQAPEAPPAVAAEGWQVVLLSGRTEAALEQLTPSVRERLDACTAEEFADVAHTSQTGRRPFAHRRYAVGADPATAAQALAGGDPLRTGTAVAGAGRPAFLFPGMGPHHGGMAAGLYRAEPVFRSHADECAALLRPRLGVDLCRLLTEAGDGSWLDDPRLSLPATFLVDYALAELLIHTGVRPKALLGHSVGEYVAACLAGVFTLPDALTLVATRGELFGAMTGAMVAIALSERELEPLLDPELSLAAVNAPASCAVSGTADAVRRLVARLDERGVTHRPVPFPAAAHSALVEPVLPRLRAALAEVRFQPARLPFVSNVTGTWAGAEVAGPDYWVSHLRRTVRFADGVRTLGVVADVLVEVGPGQTLTRLARLTIAGDDRVMVPTMRNRDDTRDDGECLAAALGELWANGVGVDWPTRHPAPRRRAAFPRYPFQRERHWIDPPAVSDRTAVPPRPPVGAATPAASVPVSPAEAAASVDRTAEVADRVAGIMSRVSGLPVDRIDRSTNLFQLGFDSVALVEAGMAINEVYGTTVPVRSMFEHLSTVDAIARHVAAELPDIPPPSGAAAAPHQPAVEVPDLGAPSSSASDVMAVVTRQIDALRRQAELQHEMFTRQLQAITGGLSVDPTPAAARQPEPEPTTVRTAGPEPARLPAIPSLTAEPLALTSQQREYLARFVERYTARTRGSRDRTDRSRLVRANFRNRENLRPDLKELVYPIFATHGCGGRIRDVDGNEYVDLTMGFGSLLLGHAPPFIDAAVTEEISAGQGMMVGPCSPHAEPVADLIAQLAGVERVAFFTSGTQAVMVAIRLARAATGRNRIVVFAGAFHGTYDATLVRRDLLSDGPNALPVGPGITVANTADVTVLDYLRPAALDTVRALAGELAAVLVEPVQSRAPGTDPGPFLAELRRITRDSGAALIFDEVITGFRLHPGGAQALFDVHADLVTYGKVVGGGMPIGVVAGDARFMDGVDGGVWRYGDTSVPPHDARRTVSGGTFCEHPLAMVAARAMLEHLVAQGPALQERLNARADAFVADLRRVVQDEAAPVTVTNFGSIVRMTVPANLELFYYHLIHHGVYLWEGRTLFLSTAHTDADLDQVLDAVRRALRDLRAGGFLPARLEPLPLTDEQRYMWAHAAMGGDAALVFHDSAVVSVDGELDVVALRGAVRDVVDRHEALRTSVSDVDGDEPVQLLHPSVDIDLEVVDCSAEGLDEWLDEQVRRPFDWARAPLLRATVVRTGPSTHALVVVAHHLVLDGWSWNVVLQDLFAAYAGRRGAAVGPGAAAGQGDGGPVGLRAFLRWRREQLDSPAATAATAYWRRVLAGPPAPLRLPPGRIAPAARVHAGRRHQEYVDAALYSRLSAVAADLRATLPMLLLAAFGLLLHRLSGRTDLIFGVPTAGQLAMRAPDLVGCCDTVLPVRLRVDPDAGFAAHLGAVRGILGEIYEHQAVSFAGLVAAADAAGEPLPSSPTTVLFNVDKPVRIPAAAGLTLSVRPGPALFARQELGLNAVDVGGSLRLDFDYDADLFDEPVCWSWFATYVAILRDIADRPDAILADLGAPPTVVIGAPVSVPAVADAFGSDPARVVCEFGDRPVTAGELAAASDAGGSAHGDSGEPAADVELDPSPGVAFPAGLVGAFRRGATVRLAGTRVATADLAAHAVAVTAAVGIPRGATIALCTADPTLLAERLLGALLCGHRLVVVDCADDPDPATLRDRIAATGADTVELPLGWAAPQRPEPTAGSVPVARLLLTGHPSTPDGTARSAFTADREFRVLRAPVAGLTVGVCDGPAGGPAPGRTVDHPIGVGAVRGRDGHAGCPGVPGDLYLRLGGGTGPAAGATGLRAWTLPDGRITLLTDEVEVRGRTVWLGALRHVLATVAGVAEVAVVVPPGGPPHRVVALVVPVPGEVHSELVRRCRESVAARLPEGYVPHAVQVVDGLPWAWTGEPAVDRAPGSRAPASPSTLDPLLARVAATWADVLDVSQVSPGDNLFDLGGTSLVAARLLTRLEKEFGVRLGLRDAFARPTVAGLSDLVRDAGSRRAADPTADDKEPELRRLPRDDSAFELSFAQRRLWYLEQLGGGVSYVVFLAVRLQGVLDIEALRRALAAVVDRHETLRTRIVAVDGVPVQFVGPAVGIALPVTDLSGLPPTERDAEVLRVAGAAQEEPFDLDSDVPLLRTRLLSLAPDTHVLILAAHHIICDGWSFDVLLRDLSALYAGDPLPELPVQYVDYADWQRWWLSGPDRQRQVRYWREALGVPPVEFELDTDRPRPAVQTFRGAVHRVDLPPDTVRALRALGRGVGTSLFVVLLAAFQALLAGVTGERDVVVATPTANRRRWETEHLVGFFVNMLVIRADLTDRPTFRELVARVAERVLAADAHADVPFELLVDELLDGREPSRPPLATVMFLMDTVPGRLRAGDLELTRLRVDWATAKYDLSLLVDNVDDDCHCVFEYNTDLFETGTVELLAQRLVTFAARVAADPQVRL